MKIGGFDTDERVLVVAEIGNNHEGDAERAATLVREAAARGADAVKLQTFRTELFVKPADSERYARMRGFELAPATVERLASLARELDLLFLSTPLDLDSAELLEPLVDAFKIASGDNDFMPLLERVGRSGRPVICSSGVSELETVRRAVDALERAGAGDVAVLHCTSSYPTEPAEANLASIPYLAGALGRTTGYSDHTMGIETAVLAVAAGARIVEKHFTLDKDTSEFRDHKLSADPPELEALVARIRAVELAVGRPGKWIQPSEQGMATAIRRSIVAAADLPSGRVLGAGDLTWMRPGDGLRPGEETSVVGRTLVRAVAHGEPIRPDDVE
jgi:sialic acid synthase SpsE